MDPFTWTFVRGEAEQEHLTIVRADEPAADANGVVRLIVTTNGSARAFEFADPDAARRFQSDMEALLLRTGWSFVGFTPERRSGRDRRGFPRLDERRRWWTDGTVSLRRFLGWSSGKPDELSTHKKSRQV